jgi:hypothetical protein
MVKILVLAAILTAPVGAAIVSGPCPVSSFTLGHTTISNCQTSITTSTPFDGSFTALGLSPNGMLPGNVIDLREPGMALLNSGLVAESFLGTITANFTMDPAWALEHVSLDFIAQDTNFFAAVSENVFFDSPCVTVVPGGSSGANWSIPSLPSAGTITLRLDIHSRACPGCIPEDAGQIWTRRHFPPPNPGHGRTRHGRLCRVGNGGRLLAFAEGLYWNGACLVAVCDFALLSAAGLPKALYASIRPFVGVSGCGMA